jgi:hypothetical protein
MIPPIPPEDPFSGSRLKLKRANHHINQLNTVLNDFRKLRPYRLVVEGDREPTTYHALTLRVRKNLPEPVPLIIGDAIHNLRSALDHALCDAIRKRGGKISKQTQFPIIEGDDLEGAIKNRGVDQAGPEILDVVRDLKPSKAGNRELWMVHDFDIDDKHKLLLPVAMVVGFHNFELKGPGKSQISSRGVRGPARDGFIFLQSPPIANLKLGQELGVAFEVEFPGGDAVIPTLLRWAKVVENVVERFAAASA